MQYVNVCMCSMSFNVCSACAVFVTNFIQTLAAFDDNIPIVKWQMPEILILDWHRLYMVYTHSWNVT